MADRNVKWIFYTVLVGLIPVFARLIVWIVDESRSVPAFDATDFIIFGLVLHISIINEIEHLHQGNQSWKTAHNGTSLLFIVILAVLFACQILDQAKPELFNDAAILSIACAMGAVSFLLSLTVLYRLSRLRS